MPSVTDRLLMHGILLPQLFLFLQQLCTVDNVIMEFLYGWCERLIVSELKNEYFIRQIF